MYEWVVDTAFKHPHTYGAIALSIFCVLEGLLVGKLFPHEILIVALALPNLDNPAGLLSILLLSVLASTVGQYGLYVFIRQYGRERVVSSRWIRISDAHLGICDRYFERWGLLALGLTNMLIVVRGWMVIPAALSNAPRGKFLLASLVGTTVYHLMVIGLIVFVGAHVFD